MPEKLVRSRPRPIRVAFFIEENEHSDTILDAIFACSFRFWGGRFSLIVPCENGRFRETYSLWLETFDPDIIYSYATLTDETIAEIHERFYPSFLVQHEVHDPQDYSLYAFRPRLPIDPLGIATLLPLVAGPFMFDPAAPTRILDTMGTSGDNRFIQDNFGSWTNSVGSSFPGHLREYGHILALIEPGELQPRDRYIRPPDETVASVTELLNSMRRGRFSTVSRLSAMVTPRGEVSNSVWGRAFNIVVGDSFNDRLFYWNVRWHFPKWRDNTFVDLRIPASFLEDADLIAAIGDFLKQYNGVSGNSGGGTPQAIIRSHSVPVDRLNKFAESLKAIHKWSYFQVQVLHSPDDIVPSSAQMKQWQLLTTESAFLRASNIWSETPFQEREIRINPPSPDHLRFGSAGLQNPYEGTWAVDLSIDRRVNYSNYENIEHRWYLPRRLRMTSSFIGAYELQSANARIMYPRTSSGGLLTLYANTGSKFPILQQPDDFVAFSRALADGRDGDLKPSVGAGRCHGVMRSENGRYFWGVLQMFESLYDANSILLSQFWRDQFDKLGSSSTASQARIEIIENTVRNRFRTNTIDLRDQDNLNTATKIILQEAEHYRTFIPLLSWAELEAAFKSVQDGYWASNPASTDVDEAEWRKHDSSRFEGEVKELCRIKILHQGYEHKCRKCLHRSWTAIDLVKSEIVCEVCGTSERAPVSRPWQFRLNEFVREAFRKHGILPIFWALSKLRDMREECFFFEGPLDIFLNQPSWEAKGPDTDLDLVCVSNGRVSMCEVKQSARQLRKAQDFGGVIRRLRPDVGILAVMEPETPAIRQRFTRFSQELSGTGIEPRLLTLQSGDFNSVM